VAAVKDVTSLKALIAPHEVVTSTELRKRLVERGHTEVNARQLIRRVFGEKKDIWRSESIVLPAGQRLFAHRSFCGRREFYREVGEILKSHRPGLARCLTLLGTSGVLTKANASRLLASPVQTGPKVPFPGYDADVQALKELGVSVCQEGTAFEYLLGAGRKQGNYSNEAAAESVKALRKETLLVRILAERLRRQNLISWGGNELPNRERILVDFNNQYFSAYGFSHLGPVRRLEEKDGKPRSVPSPVLFDVHAGLCSEVNVQSFLHRAERATCRGSRRQSWLGVVAAREFEPSAWKLARSNGLLTINFRQMFGDEALEAMARVELLLEAFQLDRPPETTDPLFLSFADSVAQLRTNPIVVDLRSIGFESHCRESVGRDGVSERRPQSHRTIPADFTGCRCLREPRRRGVPHRVQGISCEEAASAGGCEEVLH